MFNAKSVDFSAHFDHEDYWSSHVIYLASITSIETSPATNGKYVTSFVPIQIISGTIGSTNQSIESYPQDDMYSLSDQPVEFPHGNYTGQEILVSEAMNYPQVTVVRVMNFPEDQALLVVLERIANLREKPTFQMLMDGTTTVFDLESDYCLNRLLTMPDQMISNQEIKKLQSVAGDDKRPANLRIAAEEVALKFSGLPKSERSEAEYSWLHSVIQAASRNSDEKSNLNDYLGRMRPIIYKLFEFKPKRDESVDYILRLMADQNAPANLRITAGSALSDWDQNAFNFKSPDQRFHRMFNTFVTLLSDKNPDVRISGMSSLFDRTLWIMSMYSPPEVYREYAQKAVLALQQALAVEKDSRVMTYFRSREMKLATITVSAVKP